MSPGCWQRSQPWVAIGLGTGLGCARGRRRFRFRSTLAGSRPQPPPPTPRRVPATARRHKTPAMLLHPAHARVDRADVCRSRRLHPARARLQRKRQQYGGQQARPAAAAQAAPAEQQASSGFSLGSSLTQGPRPTMEDELRLVTDLPGGFSLAGAWQGCTPTVIPAPSWGSMRWALPGPCCCRLSTPSGALMVLLPVMPLCSCV